MKTNRSRWKTALHFQERQNPNISWGNWENWDYGILTASDHIFLTSYCLWEAGFTSKDVPQATVAALAGERQPHCRWETQPNCLCPAPTSLLLTSWDFSPFPPKTEYQLLNLWFCCIVGRFVLCRFHIREYGWTRIPEKAREYHGIMPTR